MNNYEIVKVKTPSESKMKKLAKTGKIAFTADELQGNCCSMFMHPMNAKLIKKAQKARKGVNAITMTGGEISYNMLNGGGIWDILKKVGSTIYKAATSDTGKKILGQVGSTLLDVGVPALVSKIGLPDEASPVARDLVKNVTGYGLKEQRLANLAKARASKKAGSGSFRMNSGGSFMI